MDQPRLLPSGHRLRDGTPGGGAGGTGELEFGSGQLTDPERARWFVEDLHSLNATARRMAAEAPSVPSGRFLNGKKWNRVSSADQAAWDVVDEGRKVVLLRLR